TGQGRDSEKGNTGRMGVSPNNSLVILLLFAYLSFSSTRVCCARFAFSNTSRNPSFRSAVERHQQQQGKNSTSMAGMFPRSTEGNSTLLTFVLVLICFMLTLIIIFTIVHCVIFCGLTIGKIRRTIKGTPEDGRLPYFVLTDYSETSPLIRDKRSRT
ncbi:hypothetical protein PMAYCL1PPCAC_30904, partial [Pristionchus mayeri]